MWGVVFQGVINWLSIVCTVLSFVIPYTVYKVNRRLHDYGDPPWKRPGYDDRE